MSKTATKKRVKVAEVAVGVGVGERTAQMAQGLQGPIAQAVKVIAVKMTIRAMDATVIRDTQGIIITMATQALNAPMRVTHPRR